MSAFTTDSDVFGNYSLLRHPDGSPVELGRGGFGRTFRAVHGFLGTEVALKVIADRLAFDEAARAQFLQEAREHVRLDHPGIARIIEFGEKDGTFYYSMELCPDGDLKEFIRKHGPLPPRGAMTLLRQAAEALRYVHECGVLHLDIKPSNLLVIVPAQGLPKIKITDFGLVKRMLESSASQAVPGQGSSWSPAFAGPEQIREQQLDERTDIFALGMTVWFLMTGRTATEGSASEMVRERLSDDSYEPLLPAGLEGALRTILARMIEKDPARRYRRFGELLAELQLALGADAPAALKTRQPLREQFRLEPAGRNFAGEVFRGQEKSSGAPVRVTVLHAGHGEPQVAQLRELGERLTKAGPSGISLPIDISEFAEGWAVVEKESTGEPLPAFLRRVGAVPLSAAGRLLREAAVAIDAAGHIGFQPAPLEMALVEGAAEPVDWRTTRILFFLQWLTPSADWAGDADMTTLPLPQSPVKLYASLIYQVLSARQVRSAALHSSTACPAIPGLGSEGNRILAASLAGEVDYADCASVFAAIMASEKLPESPPERIAGTATTSRPAPPEMLARIAAAADIARDCSRRLLQAKLPKGADDATLNMLRLEAHRAVKEIASLENRARSTSKADDRGALEALICAAEAAAGRAREAAEKFAASLAPSAPPEPVVHLLTPAVEPPSPPVPRRPARRILFAASAVGVAVGIAWLVWPPSQPPQPTSPPPAVEPQPLAGGLPAKQEPLPATIRVRSFQSRVPLPSALTIAGRSGTREGNTLVFEHAAPADGSFRPDSPRWQTAGRAVRVEENLFEAKLQLITQSIRMDSPEGTTPPWTAVTFTPQETTDLPDNEKLAALLGAKPAGSGLKFALPATGDPALPPGVYSTSWSDGEKTREGLPLTVEAGVPAVLAVPAS